MPDKVCTTGAIFAHPEPEAEQHRILPVFIPFSGCKQRCVFCAQELQTGRQAEAVGKILHKTGETLARMQTRTPQSHEGRTGEARPPLELAFYGGTFTALEQDDLETCLAFGRHWRECGVISGLRCSTRPDAINPVLLGCLRENGFSLVELGIQSFSSSALATAGRGYTNETALAACSMVRESGLKLGIQLMPGMPGVDPETARSDVLTAAELAPDYARLYPCLVLEGSGLAALWRKKLFVPWEESPTFEFLAWACLRFWHAGTRVIRMGLAPEDGLDAAILAGPHHPSMGSRARGLALHLLVADQVEKLRADCPGEQHFRLTAPLRYQGEFWGFRKELLPRYAALGIAGTGKVQWHDGHDFTLEPA